MLVSFQVFGKIFSFFSLYFWAYLKACYPYFLQVLSINKIESFNFKKKKNRRRKKKKKKEIKGKESG